MVRAEKHKKAYHIILRIHYLWSFGDGVEWVKVLTGAPDLGERRLRHLDRFTLNYSDPVFFLSRIVDPCETHGGSALRMPRHSSNRLQDMRCCLPPS